MPENTNPQPTVEELDALLRTYYKKYLAQRTDESFHKILTVCTLMGETSRGKLFVKRFIDSSTEIMEEKDLNRLKNILTYTSFAQEGERQGSSKEKLENTYPSRLAKAALLEDELLHARELYNDAVDNSEGKNFLEKKLKYLYEEWRKAEQELQSPTPGDIYVISHKSVPVGAKGVLLRVWEGEYGVRVLLELENDVVSAGQNTVWVPLQALKRHT